MASHWVKDYFTFTKRERIAIIILVLSILAVYFLPTLFSNHPSSFNERDKVRLDSLAQLFNEPDSAQLRQPVATNTQQNNPRKIELFSFDPNTASANDWARLGINQKTVSIIQHYIQRGGKFHTADDLKKIYSLTHEDYERLKTFIRIEGGTPQRISHADSSKIKIPDTSFHYGRLRKDFFAIEINSVDSTTLCRLPGIGGKLAARIIRFRDRLGGFYSIDQVAETYGLPDTTFNKIRPFLNLGAKPLVTININEANVDRLRQHPYISWSTARALVQYREQHGAFKAVEELSKISAFGSDQLKRLFPYLSTY